MDFLATKSIKKKVTLIIALLVTSVGAMTTVVAIVRHQRGLNKSITVVAAATPEPQHSILPANWRNLDIKNRIGLWLPQNMKNVEPMGDAYAYREAYSNKDINLTIVYGPVHFVKPDEADPFDKCETPRSLLENPVYHESEIVIDGKRARLGIDRKHQPDFINAIVCFPTISDKDVPFRVVAYCKDDGALQIAQQIFESITFKDK